MKHIEKKEKIKKVIAKIQGKKQCYVCERWFDPIKDEMRVIRKIEDPRFKGKWICKECLEDWLYISS